MHPTQASFLISMFELKAFAKRASSHIDYGQLILNSAGQRTGWSALKIIASEYRGGPCKFIQVTVQKITLPHHVMPPWNPDFSRPVEHPVEQSAPPPEQPQEQAPPLSKFPRPFTPVKDSDFPPLRLPLDLPLDLPK